MRVFEIARRKTGNVISVLENDMIEENVRPVENETSHPFISLHHHPVVSTQLLVDPSSCRSRLIDFSDFVSPQYLVVKYTSSEKNACMLCVIVCFVALMMFFRFIL